MVSQGHAEKEAFWSEVHPARALGDMPPPHQQRHIPTPQELSSGQMEAITEMAVKAVESSLPHLHPTCRCSQPGRQVRPAPLLL